MTDKEKEIIKRIRELTELSKLINNSVSAKDEPLIRLIIRKTENNLLNGINEIYKKYFPKICNVVPNEGKQAPTDSNNIFE